MRIETSFTTVVTDFIGSGKAGGAILILCTILSLAIANSPAGAAYLHAWHLDIGGLSVEQWINDGLMAIFFLQVGLELKRELAEGTLADPKKALLPIVAAAGGIAVPALIHFGLNHGTATQPGVGIPMATDIAFALGVLALLGRGVPASLRVFLTALAVMDDLGAIVVIALFYTTTFSAVHLAGVAAVCAGLAALRRWGGVTALAPYLLGGAAMWVLMLQSGVHPTIVGVLLAFVLPAAPSHRLEHALHKPVAFLILPVFALANTAIVVADDWLPQLLSSNGIGIIAGLAAGKPLGIMLASVGAVALGICRLPPDLAWRHVAGAGLLGGIGFTMSIFIANLAFGGATALVDASKMAILAASLLSGLAGFAWLTWRGQPAVSDAGAGA